MKIFKNTDKQSRSPALELAISEAKGAFVTLRHGDAEEDRKAGDIGVRVVICDFGNYQPFVLKTQTKDWLQRTYDLSEDEAVGVYRILLGKAKEQIRDLVSIGTLMAPPICGLMEPLKTVIFALKQGDYFSLFPPRPV